MHVFHGIPGSFCAMPGNRLSPHPRTSIPTMHSWNMMSTLTQECVSTKTHQHSIVIICRSDPLNSFVPSRPAQRIS